MHCFSQAINRELEVKQSGLRPVLIWDTDITGSRLPTYHGIKPAHRILTIRKMSDLKKGQECLKKKGPYSVVWGVYIVYLKTYYGLDLRA